MRILCLALLGLFLASAAGAQTGEPRRVVLTNGQTYAGVIEDETADPIVLIGTDGLRRQFSRASVAEVAPLIDGRFYRTDPVRTRHLLLPTARSLGAGQARIGLEPYPAAVIGLTDRIDLNATGYLAFSGDGFGITPLAGLKATVVEQPGLAVALGASGLLSFSDTGGVFDPQTGTVTGSGTRTDVLVLPYAVATFGSTTQSVTLAAGAALGNFEDGFSLSDGFVLGVGGERQINNGVKLFAEAYTVVGAADAGLLVVPGVRFFGDKLSVDIIGFVFSDFDSPPFGFAPLPARVSYTF